MQKECSTWELAGSWLGLGRLALCVFVDEESLGLSMVGALVIFLPHLVCILLAFLPSECVKIHFYKWQRNVKSRALHQQHEYRDEAVFQSWWCERRYQTVVSPGVGTLSGKERLNAFRKRVLAKLSHGDTSTSAWRVCFCSGLTPVSWVAALYVICSALKDFLGYRAALSSVVGMFAKNRLWAVLKHLNMAAGLAGQKVSKPWRSYGAGCGLH